MRKIISLLLFIILNTGISKAQIMSDSVVDATIKEAFQYLRGNGKPLNPEKAFALIKQCADAGSPRGFYTLGMLYTKGLGVAANGYQAMFWYEKAVNSGVVKALNRIGHLYKDGAIGKPDYIKAYQYFCNAADKNDREGITQKGYMLYTGLGCKQNYAAAYPLFQKGAAAGDPNAMRFLGLSMRNGYGTKINVDSAMYWLRMASRYGNGMSNDELASTTPENADIAGSLVEKVKAAQKIIRNGNPVNKYTKIQHSIPANNIEGKYSGWLLKYDWSGEHVVKADQLNIDIIYKNNVLQGNWIENDSVSIPLTAFLTKDALVFKDMQYNKHDHYYKSHAEILQFEKAGLQLVNNNDTVYLCGNLQMYSVSRKEPAKPMFVALVRTNINQKANNKSVPLVNEDGTPIILKKLNAFPNPFTNIITLDFELKESCNVLTKLQTIEGKVVYINDAGKLAAGNYTLPIQPQELAAGTYLLTLQCGKQISTLKVVKL